MAKSKRKPTKEALSAPEIHAEGTVTSEARNHAEYVRVSFTERDLEGGEMSGARMERIAPVRALEGLARINPKSDKPYLTPIMILASRKYYILMEAAKGKLNHEIIEPVDKSVDSDGRLVSHLTANDRFTRLRLKMPMDFSAMADLLYVKMPDRSLTQIWPNKTLRENSKVIIRDMLIWLSVEFGDASN